MKPARIRLAYRNVIDQSSTLLWDKYVYEDTFKEYLMQHQLYNSKENHLPTFRELLAENDKAEKLHFLTGMAANVYVQQLKGKLHRVPDALGSSFFPIANYRLDIINTDIRDSSKHRIGITFYSPLLTLIDVINNCFLVSENTETGSGYETLMFPLQPNLSICYYERKEARTKKQD